MITNIGKMILQRRTELNMSQEELARKVGYKDRSSIARIESGERDIRQKKVVEFADALQTTPAKLMGYDDEQKTAPTEAGLKGCVSKIIIKKDLSELIRLDSIARELPEDDINELIRHAELLLLKNKVNNPLK